MALECLNQNTNEVRTAFLIMTVDRAPRRLPPPPQGLLPRGLVPMCPEQDRPDGLDPGGTGSQFFVSVHTPALPAPGAEPLIGAMGIFSLTCAGTGHGELNGNS